jgi:hypothetical protein
MNAMFHTQAQRYSCEASDGGVMICATAVDDSIDLIRTVGVKSGMHAPESYPPRGPRLEELVTACKLQRTKYYVAF